MKIVDFQELSIAIGKVHKKKETFKNFNLV